MPKFHLRSWAEQVLFDCEDYEVQAATLEEAVALLEELQEQADDKGMADPHPDVEGDEDGVTSLDPSDIVSGDSGITLVDEDGKRLRDLVSVPTGCAKLGTLLDEEATRDATEPQLDPTAILLDDLNCDVSVTLEHLAAGRLDEARSTLKAMADGIREALAVTA